MLMDYRETFQKTVEVTISCQDVFNWLTQCYDIEILKYLGKYALKCAKDLENQDWDDFRSRA